MLKKIIAISVLLVIVLPILTFAQAGIQGSNSSAQTGTNVTIGNPTSAGGTIFEVINTLFQGVVMPIAAVAVVFWIIWAGFSYITAQGIPAKVTIAHQRLLWSLIGAGILLGAAGISQVVKTTINSLLN